MASRPLLLLLVAAVAACPGGSGDLGDVCSSHSECDTGLQCAGGVCVPTCQRGPDCGDGYACNRGYCELASGQPGDGCSSETECAPGLSCQLDGVATGADEHLLASCTSQNTGAPPGALCFADEDCRNGTCALGHCVDLCNELRDCSVGYSCQIIPRVKANGALFAGCLPSKGNVSWTIPNSAPTSSILFPVPSGARSAQLVFSVDDTAQRVGAASIYSPRAQPLYTPCNVATEVDCDPIANFYEQIIRHQPLFGQSVITMPTTPLAPLETGAYRVQISSYRPNGTPGSAIPHVRASVRIDVATLLDLHFHFLNLQDHMCEAAFGNAHLDAAAARTAPFFQDDYLQQVRRIFQSGGIALGNITYEDLADHPELDGLDVRDAGSLLKLSTSSTGINVFFVRTLSPVGLLAFGPNPGPAGLAGTTQSGIIIGLDTLCYRSWAEVARITAHELARYMGLNHNVELGANDLGNNWRDNIEDTDDSESNLMFFSEFGGTEITDDQQDILTRSGVLR